MAIQSMYGTNNNEEENQGTSPLTNYLGFGASGAKNLSATQQPMYQRSSAGNAGTWTNLMDVVKANDINRVSNQLNTAAENKIQKGTKSVQEEISNMPALPTANTYTSTSYKNLASGGFDPNELNQIRGYMGQGEQAKNVGTYEKKADLTTNPFKDFDTSSKDKYTIDTIQGIFGKPTGSYSKGMGLLDELLYSNTPGWKDLGTKLNEQWQSNVVNPYTEATANRSAREVEARDALKQAQKSWIEGVTGESKAVDDRLEALYNDLLSKGNTLPMGVENPANPYTYYEGKTGVSTIPYLTNKNPVTKQAAFSGLSNEDQLLYNQLADLVNQSVGADEGYIDRGLEYTGQKEYKPEWSFDKTGWEKAATEAGQNKWKNQAADKYNTYLGTEGVTPGQTISRSGTLYKIPTLDEYINSLGEYSLYKEPSLSDVYSINMGADPNYKPTSDVTLPGSLDQTQWQPTNNDTGQGTGGTQKSDEQIKKEIEDFVKQFESTLAAIPKPVTTSQDVAAKKKTKKPTIYGGGK